MVMMMIASQGLPFFALLTLAMMVMVTSQLRAVDLLHNHFLGFQENPLPLADFIWIAPQHDDGADGADDYDRGVVVMMPMTTGKGGACCAQTLA